LTEFSQNSPLTTVAPGSDAPIRVALILSSRLERLGWGIVVESQADMQVVGQFSTLKPALAFLMTDPVDVALVDEAMLTPKICESIRAVLPGTWPRFLMLARHPVDRTLARARYPFVSGCLLNGVTADDFLDAIRAAR
jgi:DNA-binding NarL/FixJ family response regulator